MDVSQGGMSRFAVGEKNAGERTGVVADPVHPTNAPSAGIFQGFVTGDMVTLFYSLRNLSDAPNPKSTVFARVCTDGTPAP